jgi:hypothetical protein
MHRVGIQRECQEREDMFQPPIDVRVDQRFAMIVFQRQLRSRPSHFSG